MSNFSELAKCTQIATVLIINYKLDKISHSYLFVSQTLYMGILFDRSP